MMRMHVCMECVPTPITSHHLHNLSCVQARSYVAAVLPLLALY